MTIFLVIWTCRVQKQYHRLILTNPQIRLHKSHNTYDPASLVGVKLSEAGKSFLLHLDPHKPSKKVLKQKVQETRRSYTALFTQLVAKTCDRVSNMSGCYNRLQAIIKERIGKHILYVHCYAYSLSIKRFRWGRYKVAILFDSLESLHLFNRCHKIHGYFEKAQQNVNVEVTTI